MPSFWSGSQRTGTKFLGLSLVVVVISLAGALTFYAVTIEHDAEVEQEVLDGKTFIYHKEQHLADLQHALRAKADELDKQRDELGNKKDVLDTLESQIHEQQERLLRGANLTQHELDLHYREAAFQRQMKHSAEMMEEWSRRLTVWDAALQAREGNLTAWESSARTLQSNLNVQESELLTEQSQWKQKFLTLHTLHEERKDLLDKREALVQVQEKELFHKQRVVMQLQTNIFAAPHLLCDDGTAAAGVGFLSGVASAPCPFARGHSTFLNAINITDPELEECCQDCHDTEACTAWTYHPLLRACFLERATAHALPVEEGSSSRFCKFACEELKCTKRPVQPTSTREALAQLWREQQQQMGTQSSVTVQVKPSRH